MGVRHAPAPEAAYPAPTEAVHVETTIAAIEVALHLVRADAALDATVREQAERRLADGLRQAVRLLAPPAQDSFL